MLFVNEKHKSRIPWNKGKPGLQVAWNKGKTKKTDSRIAKYSKSLEGHENFNKQLKGCFIKGQKNPRKGTGKQRYWNDPEYIKMRKNIFMENNYTCLSCGKRGGKIELHHLMPTSLFPEQINNPENVIVLCRKCHTFTDTYGLSLVRKRGEFRENLKEIILSQAREETLLKVQRLTAEAKAKSHASNADTSALPERDDIV